MSHRDKAGDDGGGDAGLDEGPRRRRSQTARDPNRILTLINSCSIGREGWWPLATKGDVCALSVSDPVSAIFVAGEANG